MDLSIRDWMLVIGVMLILAVLLDGYRRVRRDRAKKVRMSLKPVPATGEEEQLTRGELPNGGARLAPRGGRNAADQHEPTFGDEWETDVRISTPSFSEALSAAASGFAAQGDDADLPDVDTVKSQFSPVHSEPLHEPEPAARVAAVAADDIAEPVAALRAESSRRSEPKRQAAALEPEPMAAVADPVPAPTGVKEIIVVNAVSKDPLGFNGEELLHILLTCDLRFGKMNIFHRYEKSNAKGAVQFSVANSVEPGTFDLNNMRSFKTPGICLFLQLPGPQDAQKALEYMVETAQCIARNLNGELRDENRSALTAQTVEHFRSRIREFDRKRMAKHA